MNKTEFLEQLDLLLRDISDEERTEALRFYSEYFSDAGPFEEENILNELVSPEHVAASIKQGLNENKEENPHGSHTDRSIPLPIYARPRKEQPGQVPPLYKESVSRMDRKSRNILLILLAVLLFPIWVGLLTGVVGVLIGIVSAGIALLVGGVVSVITSVVVLVLKMGLFMSAGIGTALVTIGLLFLAMLFGVLIAGLGTGILFWFIPSLWKIFKKFVIAPLCGKRGVAQ